MTWLFTSCRYCIDAHTDAHRLLFRGCHRQSLSNPFKVAMGLRQGCVLSSLLFLMYINGVVEKLREAKVGVNCGVECVPALLFADDMVTLPEGEEELRSGLGVLA